MQGISVECADDILETDDKMLQHIGSKFLISAFLLEYY